MITPGASLSSPANVVVRLNSACCSGQSLGFDDTYSVHLNGVVSRETFGTVIAGLNLQYQQLMCGSCRGGVKKFFCALVVLSLVALLVTGIFFAVQGRRDYRAWKKQNPDLQRHDYYEQLHEAGKWSRGCMGTMMIGGAILAGVLLAVAKCVCTWRRLRRFDGIVREQLAALNKTFVPNGVQWRYNVVQLARCSWQRWIEIEVSAQAVRTQAV